MFRMLGFDNGNATFNNDFGPVPAVGPGMDDVQCVGTETDIRSCPHLTSGNCGPTEGAGVRCFNNPPPDTTTQGKNNSFVTRHRVMNLYISVFPDSS